MALIERKALIDKLSEIPGFKDEECETLIPLRDVRTLINMIPIVEAEPVDKERWHYYVNDEGKARWRCTRCGKVCRRDPHDKKWCSGCGAKMTKEA